MNKITVTDDKIEMNGKTYVPQGQSENFSSPIKIVVLQRGWVYIGRFERNGNDCRLLNSYNIRVWGTSKGLAELVNGATKDTNLDKCDGVVEFDWLTVVHTISVNETKWTQI